MPRRLPPFVFWLVSAAAAAGCASTQPSGDARPTPSPPPAQSVAAPAAQTVAAAPHEWEPWPPADAAKPAAPRPSGERRTVRLLPKDGGYTMLDVLEMVVKATGTSILYDNYNATFKQAKVEFVGERAIDEADLFAWLQAVLSTRKLVMVPIGPKSADGKQQWYVMDQADPNLKSRPVFLEENEVFDYGDRDGLYVVTSLRVRDTVDVTRVRNMLSPLSTQTAGIGRIMEDGARHLVVGDFAPVVAAMKRLLDRINADTPPSAVRPPVVVPQAAKAEK